MNLLFGLVVAVSLATSTGDPRTIDPAANRPEIVEPKGGVTNAKTPGRRPHKKRTTETTDTTPTKKPRTNRRRTTPDPEETGNSRRANRRARRRPSPETGTDGPTDSTGEGCMAEKRRCWQLSVGGIAAASVGFGMLATGIGFTQAPTFPVPEEPISDRSLRPPGIVLATFGGVALVTGVVMIIAGRVSYKRNQKAQVDGFHLGRLRIVPGGVRW
ncbi:MAG: hypothetical protein K0V04_45690 [Deltaproteobacteria bacterium]|nr:hypothetical protein [Deltaproteobacteria bacterium]